MPKTIIYNDTPLSAEHGIAYRKAVLTAAKKEDVLVLPPFMGPKNVVTALEVLSNIKRSDGYPQPTDPAKKTVFDTFVKFGWLQADGRAKAGLQAKLRTNPRIEMIYQVSKDHYAVIVFTKAGMAYVDPKGAPCPNDPITVPKAPKPIPFLDVLKNYWLDFSGESESVQRRVQAGGGTEDEKREKINKAFGQLVAKACKVHTVEQQKDNFSSLDWCLTNLDILGEDITDTSSQLKSEEKIKREAIIGTIQGLEIPPGDMGTFDLDYQDISQVELKRQAWRLELENIERCSEEIAEEGRAIYEANPEAELSAKVRVLIEKPQSKNIEPGKFEHYHYHFGTTIINTIVVEESEDKITGESKGGTATFYARFLKIARDFDAACQREYPIVVLSLSHSEEGKRAFRAYFGDENVQFADENPEPGEGLLVAHGV